MVPQNFELYIFNWVSWSKTKMEIILIFKKRKVCHSLAFYFTMIHVSCSDQLLYDADIHVTKYFARGILFLEKITAFAKLYLTFR